MNKKVKAKWLKALRSGEYEQGAYFLKINREGEAFYCCLGVLCDLYRKETGKRWDKPSDEYPTFMREISALPKKVMKWAGIKEQSGFFAYRSGKTDSLVRLNDSRKSFKQIANIIEKYF